MDNHIKKVLILEGFYVKMWIIDILKGVDFNAISYNKRNVPESI